MKYNWQFDEGLKGLKLNCDYMSKMSECNTAQSPPSQVSCYIAISLLHKWVPDIGGSKKFEADATTCLGYL